MAAITTMHPTWCCRDELGEPDPRVHRSERIRVDRGTGATADVLIERGGPGPDVTGPDVAGPDAEERGTRIVLSTEEGGEVSLAPEGARELAIALLRQSYAALGSR